MSGHLVRPGHLDEAVFAAYGWNHSMSDEEILAKLLELNLQQSAERR